MSHFTVMVIGNNPEKQLEPFNENIEVERYIEYTKEELIAKGRKTIEDYKNTVYAKYLENPEEYIKDGNPYHVNYITNEFPQKLNYTDDEVYQQEVANYEVDEIGEKGEVYSTYNPHSKWDWYMLGGRWAGFLALKTGEWCDQALKGNIDFELSKKDAYDNAGIKWDEIKNLLSEFPKPNSWEYVKDVMFKNDMKAAKEFYKNQPAIVEFNKEHLFEDYDDYNISKEEYCNNAANQANKTFAYLKDGEWCDRGEMGWWGSVSNEKDINAWQKEFNDMFNEIPDDTLISIYDCHI